MLGTLLTHTKRNLALELNRTSNLLKQKTIRCMYRLIAYFCQSWQYYCLAELNTATETKIMPSRRILLNKESYTCFFSVFCRTETCGRVRESHFWSERRIKASEVGRRICGEYNQVAWVISSLIVNNNLTVLLAILSYVRPKRHVVSSIHNNIKSLGTCPVPRRKKSAWNHEVKCRSCCCRKYGGGTASYLICKRETMNVVG